MPNQEAVHEGKKPFKGRLGRKIARVAYITFYAVSLLLLLGCIVAWIVSYTATYSFIADWYSLRNDGPAPVFSRRYALFGFSNGEAVLQVGKNVWDRVPTVPWKPIKFFAGQVPGIDDLMLPENAWHRFCYEVIREPADPRNYILAESSDGIYFPFWSAFVVLLVPPLIWL